MMQTQSRGALVCVCVCFAVMGAMLVIPALADAETVMRWRGGAVTCVPHMEYGVPDVYSGFGYANIRPNPDTSGDDNGTTADSYCPIPYDIGYVNEILVYAAENYVSNSIRATLHRCSLSSGYCYDIGDVLSSYHASPSLYRSDLDGSYDISLDQSTSYYYVIEISLDDANEQDEYYPRAYWVGLDYDTDHGVLSLGSEEERAAEIDPYPECAAACSGDCSFLSHLDDERWSWDALWDECLE